MATKFLSPSQIAHLNRFPENISFDDVASYFKLTSRNRQLVQSSRGEQNRLGMALQLCTLRYLGFVPNELSTIARHVVEYVAEQLTVGPDALEDRKTGPVFVTYHQPVRSVSIRLERCASAKHAKTTATT